jgi:hypothetical protein
MPYKLISFEKEQSAVSGTLYVAMIQKEGEEQPFRMSVEHFKTEEEAMAEVNKWIATQDEDDARWEAEQARAKAEEAGDATIEALNKNLK